MHIKYILVSLAFTLLASWIIPTEFTTEDTAIHVPFIKKILTPELYEGDYIFLSKSPQAEISFYYLSLAFVSKQFNLTIKALYEYGRNIYFFLFFITLFVYSQKFFTRISIGMILGLIVFFHIPIGGTATFHLEAEIIPRALGMLMSLIILYLILTQRKRQGILFVGVAFAVHPLSAFYTLCLIGVYMLYKEQFMSPSRIIYFFCTILGLLIFLNLINFNLLSIDRFWLSIIRFRNSYAFLDLWNIVAWFNLLVTLVPGLIFLNQKKTRLHKWKFILRVTYFTAIIITFVHICFALIYPIDFVISLQLLRIWYYPTACSLACFAYYVTNYFKSRISKSVLLGIFLFVAVVFLSNKSNHTSSQWLEVGDWVSINIKKNCTFLVPFYSKGFRAISNRSSSGEFKDGALSFYSKEFALSWYKRYQDLHNWETLTTAQIGELSYKYHFQYIVESKNQERNLTKVYFNDNYQIYQISPLTICK